MKNQITWICFECAGTLGASIVEDHVATCHCGRCCVCCLDGVTVTEPRDFFWPNGRPSLKEARSVRTLVYFNQVLNALQSPSTQYTHMLEQGRNTARILELERAFEQLCDFVQVHGSVVDMLVAKSSQSGSEESIPFASLYPEAAQELRKIRPPVDKDPIL